jgi:hypothetical protein
MVPSSAAVLALIDEYKTQKKQNRSTTLAMVSNMMCKEAMKRLRSTSKTSRGGSPQESSTSSTSFADLPTNVIRKITNNNSLLRRDVKSLARSTPATIPRWDERPKGLRLSKIELDVWIKTHKDLVPEEWKQLGEFNMYGWLKPYYKLFWRMMDPEYPYARDCKSLTDLLRKSPIALTNDEYRRVVYHNQAVATLEAMVRGSFIRDRMLIHGDGDMFEDFPSSYERRQGAKHFSLHIADVAYEHCDKDMRNLAREALVSLLRLYTNRAMSQKKNWWAIYDVDDNVAEWEPPGLDKFTILLTTLSDHPLFVNDDRMNAALHELVESVESVDQLIGGSRRKRSIKRTKKYTRAKTKISNYL